jgi:hypothetical protein
MQYKMENLFLKILQMEGVEIFFKENVRNVIIQFFFVSSVLKDEFVIYSACQLFGISFWSCLVPRELQIGWSIGAHALYCV